ncbi:hypothetical protein C8T65DRAFT_745023 [Cerioporus squamosus]|nr:hypothetical protein C8T65DRAFT_745023 [Cerioporus squamosus]
MSTSLARMRAAATKRKAQEQARRDEKRRKQEEEAAEAEAEEWHGLGLGGDEEDDMAAVEVEPLLPLPRQPSPPPPPPAFPTSLAGLPAHIRPPTPPPQPPGPPAASSEDMSPVEQPDPDPGPPAFSIRTEPNAFGVYREYMRRPQHDPEERKTLQDLLDPAAFPHAAPSTDGRVPSAFREVQVDPDIYAPMRNMSEFLLLKWQYDHPNVSSNRAVNALVRDVIHAPGFSALHFPPGFTIEGAQARLEGWDTHDDTASVFPLKHGGRHARVLVRIPKEGVKFASEELAPQFPIDDVLVRDLLDVFVDTYKSSAACDFHWIPHRMMCRPSSRLPVNHASQPQQSAQSLSLPPEERLLPRRVYTEFYNSDEMLDADADLQARPRHPDDPPDLEYAIGPILLWSDSTHLASFGTASLWPIYAYTGLQSKYTRGRPTSFSAQHIAYIPSLPDDFTDWFMKTFDGTLPEQSS